MRNLVDDILFAVTKKASKRRLNRLHQEIAKADEDRALAALSFVQNGSDLGCN